MKTDDVKCYIDDDEVDCENWKDNPMRNELLLLLKNNAYRKGEFTLSSGRTSEHYVNCKPVTLSARGLTLSSILMLELI